MEQVAVEIIKEWGLIGIVIVVISAACGFLGYLYYNERKNNVDFCKRGSIFFVKGLRE